MNKEITGKNKKIAIIAFIGIIVVAFVFVIMLLVRNDDNSAAVEEKNDTVDTTDNVDANSNSSNKNSDDKKNTEISFDNVDDYVKYMKEQVKEDVLVINDESQLTHYGIITVINDTNIENFALELADCINSNVCQISGDIGLLADNDLIRTALSNLKKREMNSNYICYKKEIVDNVIRNLYGKQDINGSNYSSTVLKNYYCDFPSGGGNDFAYYDSKLEENQWVGYYRNNNNTKIIKIIFESIDGNYRITKINTEIVDN